MSKAVDIVLPTLQHFIHLFCPVYRILQDRAKAFCLQPNPSQNDGEIVYTGRITIFNIGRGVNILHRSYHCAVHLCGRVRQLVRYRWRDQLVGYRWSDQLLSVLLLASLNYSIALL